MRHFCLPLLMGLLLAGCAHEQFVTDARHPEVAVDDRGVVTYRGEPIDPDELPDLLKDSGLTSRDTIHIHIPSGLTDYRKPYYVMGVLVKNGFTRPVFVEDRKAYSEVYKAGRANKALPPPTPAHPAKRVIRYK
ncbi:MAG: hypothetical protein MJ240_11850 [Kiritimatiellae bacterium]|nr:hypothetical protein [Kiritimatiellia bacterium]